MDAPVFLSVDNVLRLHTSTITVEGGAVGIRDLALLESAVLTPQQQFAGEYLHPSVPSMAAAYLFHLCSNHPFVDGNKRVAAMAAYVFLDINGWSLDATESDFERIVLRIAAGESSKVALTDWFRNNASMVKER